MRYRLLATTWHHHQLEEQTDYGLNGRPMFDNIADDKPHSQTHQLLAMTIVIDIFRVLASCTSLTMLLSPIPHMYKIYKNKSTGVASILPLVGMFNNSHVVMMFGYLTKQYFPVFSTFVVGDFLALFYISLFYRYSHERAKAHRIFAMVGFPLLIASIYSLLGGYGYTNQSRRSVGNVIGYYSIPAAALLYAAPLEKVGKVLKHRSAVFLPIHMVVTGTTNNFMWVMYGSLTGEWLIFTPNFVCCVLGCFQIGLYFVFHPSTHPLTEPLSKAKEDDIDVELGSVPSSPTASSNAHSESVCFQPLASPLEPLPHK